MTPPEPTEPAAGLVAAALSVVRDPCCQECLHDEDGAMYREAMASLRKVSAWLADHLDTLAETDTAVANGLDYRAGLTDAADEVRAAGAVSR